MLSKYFLFLSCTTLFASPGYFEPWGSDAGLKPASIKAVEEPSILSKVADAVIRFHQEVLSPVDGPRSHFRPSSSQYMQQAIHKYGFLRGYIMGCDRLLRENDEEWVYRTVYYDGRILKYDPACLNKSGGY